MTCYFHPNRQAAHTDVVVDLDGPSSPGSPRYKRVPICWFCAEERKAVGTSHVEALEKGEEVAE